MASTKPFKAFYFDGKTARRRPAAVRLLKAGLKISLQRSKVLSWPYAEIRQEQGDYAGEPVRLERGHGVSEALLFQGPEILSALHGRLGAVRAKAFHDPSTRDRRFWRVLQAGIATLALGAAFHFWIIPALASTLAAKLPVTWEKKLGDSALQLFAPPEDRRMAPKLQQVIDGIVDRLANVEPSRYSFQVIIVESPIVNAFALPGGTIVVMSGLLEKTKSPEELAGVLAHEMQHVILRHGTRRVLESSQAGLLFSVLSGDASGVIFGAQSAAELMRIHYGQKDETDADLKGMQAIIASGIDPQGMVRTFQMLKKNEKLPAFLKYISTHPGIDDRIAALKASADSADVEITPIPLPHGRTWKSLVHLPHEPKKQESPI